MNDLISRAEAINRSYWHGESYSIYKSHPSGSEAVDVTDLEALPSEKNKLAAILWDKTPEEVYVFLEKLYENCLKFENPKKAMKEWLEGNIIFLGLH